MAKDARTHQQLLGFLGFYHTIGGDGYLGALLITDHQGVPEEFRCTLPVKPTVVQRPLFGDALEPHIAVNLCGVRLIESAQHKPALILVNKPFLTRVRASAPCPVVFVEKAGEKLKMKLQGQQHDAPEIARLESPTGSFQPVVVSPHHDFDTDLAPALEVLNASSRYLDPTEPFLRMEQAIQMLAKQDKRYR